MTTLRTTRYEGTRPPVLRPQFAQRMAAERERDWGAIRLLALEFEADRPLIPAGHRRVRAAIHLGRLTPADVRVHLATVRALAHDMAPHEARRIRLTCAQPYGNGVYVFEGHVVEAALDAPALLRVLVEQGLRAGGPEAPAGRRRILAAPGG